jgi:uncharacterized protein
MIVLYHELRIVGRLYNLNRERIRALLTPIVSLKGLKLSKRSVFLAALDLYATTALDFVDALAIAQMEAWRVAEVYSYDEHFDLVSGIKRLEP